MIFDFIRDEHGRIHRDLEAISAHLNTLWDDDRQLSARMEGILEAFQSLKRDLLVHMLAEEEAVYNRLREKPATKIFSYEGDEQHEIIHTLLDKLEDEEIDSDGRWLGTFIVLRELIDQHVALEESRVFAEMQKSFSTDELRDMTRQMREEKLIVSESLHNAFLDRDGEKNISWEQTTPALQ